MIEQYGKPSSEEMDMVWIWMGSMIGFALANGQSTHLWISERAIEQLPNGELKTLLSINEQQWRNGTMFPDGGYAVEDNYGEISHWEPFQLAYLQWIKDTYSMPWSNEAQEHIAFLMGLGSHGLADQSFDAMYFRRSYVYDAQSDWSNSLDIATDVVFISKTYTQPTVDPWIPIEPLLDIFLEQGHTVSDDVIELGQSRLNVAVYWVGSASEQAEVVVEYEQQFPWTSHNLLNESIPGNPYMESEIIKEYWQVLWKELQGDNGANKVLYCDPKTTSYSHPRSKDDIESSLSIGLSSAIDTDKLEESHISVEFENGQQHPVLVDVFYGDGSNIINIEPLIDWDSGQYTVLLSSELPLEDGSDLGGVMECTFSTTEKPTDSKSGCQTSGFSRSGWWGLMLILGVRRWT